MKALAINLERDSDRWRFQEEQALRLGINVSRLPAVTVDAIRPPPDSDHWKRWQRPLREVEMATLLSHMAAWKTVISTREPMLILEDDAWLAPQVKDYLTQVANLQDVEHLSLETRGRKKLLGSPHPQMSSVRRLWLDRSGAAAYVLWPEGARKLLARADAVPGLADAVLVETPGLKRWQAAPALAIQVDMAEHYGLTPPMVVHSGISSVPRPKETNLTFRLRRVSHQIAMGLTGLRPGVERVELRPSGL